MKQLLILSGKGGTGKTTTAAAFIQFSNTDTFADCDVDAPNLHLVTHMNCEPKKKPYLGSEKAYINPDLCIGCGRCMANCRFDSIFQEDGHCCVNLFACEGCGVCTAVCPAAAIEMKEDVAGELMLYQNNEKTFSTAQLKMGRGNSGKLVTEVKAGMWGNKNESPLTIIDGSPGIGCPVIASISGVDMVLIVAEPSLSGMSDMERIIKTCSIFGTKAGVCVNKYDTCPENAEAIHQFCVENNLPFLGTIPYDSHVPEAVNRGESIADIDCPARDALLGIYENVKNILL